MASATSLDTAAARARLSTVRPPPPPAPLLPLVVKEDVGEDLGAMLGGTGTSSNGFGAADSIVDNLYTIFT